MLTVLLFINNMSKNNKKEKTEKELAKEIVENWISETLDKYDKEKDKKSK